MKRIEAKFLGYTYEIYFDIDECWIGRVKVKGKYKRVGSSILFESLRRKIKWYIVKIILRRNNIES